ncbi:MAG TPA: YihY/virulence factor BrkB family protein [Planctomycetaceae bacterium]|nr:YihY/virulence factor BrkB family protein [Planctomycetaceae bacterium]
MDWKRNRALELARAVAREFAKDDCASMAAALAYYAVFSMPGLLVIVVWVAGMAFDPQQVRDRIGGEIREVVGSDGGEQVETMLEHAERPERSTPMAVIGIAALLFGATGVLAQLQTSLNRAWRVKPDPHSGGLKQFVLKRILSLAMVLVIGFLLLAALVVTAAVSAVSQRVLPGSWSAPLLLVANFAVDLVVVTLLFAAMYKVLPDAQIAWRDVWVGAGVTAVLFVAGKFALGFYLGRSNVGSAYGAAGSLALILVWVYYSGLIVLLGAEFTQVWARRYGTEIQPAAGAVRVVEKTFAIRNGRPVYEDDDDPRANHEYEQAASAP